MKKKEKNKQPTHLKPSGDQIPLASTTDRPVADNAVMGQNIDINGVNLDIFEVVESDFKCTGCVFISKQGRDMLEFDDICVRCFHNNDHPVYPMRKRVYKLRGKS